MAGGSLGPYLMGAFLNRWNLLLVMGAVVAAVLTPWPDALLPLVAAGELTYLTGLVSRPRFRKAVDARLAARQREGHRTEVSGEAPSLIQLVDDLSDSSRHRFGRLRARCLEMERIAQGAQGKVSRSGRGDVLRIPALDKLLWMFLRLLLAKQALDAFIETTDAVELTEDLDSTRGRYAKAQEGGDQRTLASLQDSIAVAELRLENYGKATKNAEFMDLELDRIEGKIQALVEMAVLRQDPDFLTSQVDAVAESVQQTEGAIRELQSITGLAEAFEAPPAILEADFSDTVGNEA
jgi:hypothetical protein